MTPGEINSICARHDIRRRYWAEYESLILYGRISSRKFGRLIRRNLRFKTCLGEMLDVLSLPHRRYFEPTHFESLEIK